MSKLFEDMDLREKIAHIRKCQKQGVEEIRKGSPACLADIADHLDIWGPWLCNTIESMLDSDQEILARLNKISAKLDEALLKYKDEPQA